MKTVCVFILCVAFSLSSAKELICAAKDNGTWLSDEKSPYQCGFTCNGYTVETAMVVENYGQTTNKEAIFTCGTDRCNDSGACQVNFFILTFCIPIAVLTGLPGTAFILTFLMKAVKVGPRKALRDTIKFYRNFFGGICQRLSDCCVKKQYEVKTVPSNQIEVEKNLSNQNEVEKNLSNQNEVKVDRRLSVNSDVFYDAEN